MDLCWFLIHNGFGNMAYMLSCGLPCLRRKGAMRRKASTILLRRKGKAIETGRKLH